MWNYNAPIPIFVACKNAPALDSHRYFPHTPALKSVIRCIWQTGGMPGARVETIVPKGTIEIIFDFSEIRIVNALFQDRPCQLSRCFINGYNDIPIRIEWPSTQHFMGVEFHPLAIKKILGIPPVEFANQAIDLTLVHPEFNLLWHRLAEQKTFEERVAVMTGWVADNMVYLEPHEQLLNDTMGQLCLVHHSIPALASALHYSPRHLSRKIQAITGMNSEEFLHYKKFFYAVHLLHHSQFSLTEIAHQCHFSDQSHFIKTFHKFAGMTPGAYQKQKSVVMGHLFENM